MDEVGGRREGCSEREVAAGDDWDGGWYEERVVETEGGERRKWWGQIMVEERGFGTEDDRRKWQGKGDGK